MNKKESQVCVQASVDKGIVERAKGKLDQIVKL